MALVSIRAGRWIGGRPRSPSRHPYPPAFQSAPAVGLAGDADHRRGISHGSRFNPRPPLDWRATTEPEPTPEPTRVSIRARRWIGGRRPVRPPYPDLRVGFNPRPPLDWRATLVGLEGHVERLVSIRARRWIGGRRAAPVPVGPGIGVSIRARRWIGGRRHRAGDRRNRPPQPIYSRSGGCA